MIVNLFHNDIVRIERLTVSTLIDNRAFRPPPFWIEVFNCFINTDPANCANATSRFALDLYRRRKYVRFLPDGKIIFDLLRFFCVFRSNNF